MVEHDGTHADRCTSADGDALSNGACRAEFTAIPDSDVASHASGRVQRAEVPNHAVVADVAAAIQDAVITKSNVGCHVAATKNRTSRTHAHRGVSPNVGMHDETPIGNAKRLQALHNGSPRAWVIDGD